MATRLWILADAVAEIDSARQWYDTQHPGLGQEFLAAVERAVEMLAVFPDAHPLDYRQTRRYLLERFPYCLYYQVDPEGVVVVALLHAARNPATKRRRLRG